MEDNKGLVIISIVGMLLFLLSITAVIGAKPSSVTPKYDDGNLVAPDYNNGASDTFNVGSSRTFNYNCHCAAQAKNPACSGNIRLQIDFGSGFVNEKSDSCNVASGATCSASYVKTFSANGVYKLRVFCDESTGTDFTQPSNEYVTLTVEGCVNGATRPCPLQQGVCAGSVQTCSNNQWSECDYGINYGQETAFGCDGLDNDCNGIVDEIDADNDGFSPCGGIGTLNEVWVEGSGNNWANINVYAYNPSTSTYNSIWSITETVGDIIYGGAIGDITHDGRNDIVVPRYVGSTGTDVWTYNQATGEFYKVWAGTPFGPYSSISSVMDLDNDGFTEFIFIYGPGDSSGRVEIWGNDNSDVTSFSQEHVLRTGQFMSVNAIGCDLNNNGVPEIITQGRGQNFMIYEWNGADYQWKQNISVWSAYGGGALQLNDMNCGDLNRDGVSEAVVCGNDNKDTVIDYVNGNYQVVYNSPTTSGATKTVRSCNIADMTNDGWQDFVDVNGDNVRVFSYNPVNSSYYRVWNGANVFSTSTFAASADAGDSDNDGMAEFIHGPDGDGKSARVWESNSLNAKTFSNAYNFTNQDSFTNILIGDINPYNDGGVDCNDNDPNIYPGHGC